MILRMFLRRFELGSKVVLNPQSKHSVMLCREYAEKVISKKVFKPSFEAEPAEVENEITRKQFKSYNERMKEKTAQQKKVRKLNKLEKFILVRLGKFKSIDEVPDQLVFKTAKEKAEALQEMKVGALSQAFQIGYALEYLLTFLTLGFFAFVYNYYNKSVKELMKKVDD